MNISDLQTILKTSGYEVVPGKSQTSLIIMSEKGENRKLILQAIKDLTNGELANSCAYSKTGGVKVDNRFWVVVKPKLSSNLSALDARVFASLGESSKFVYQESNVTVKKFTTVKQLEESIIKGCKETPTLGDPVAEICNDIFSGNNVSWGNIQDALKNKLAVYLGELLIGWCFLKGQNQYIENYSIPKRVAAFILPTDPSFSGVDSFVIFDDNSYVALSSKAGGGAKASIFANLIPLATKLINNQPNTEFTKFVKFLKEKNIDPAKAKDAVWNYGIRSIFKLDNNKIKDPVKVQEKIRLNSFNEDPECMLVIGSAINDNTIEQNIKSNLPHSLSVYFSKRIAALMNKDSTDQINNILQGKKYWQVNLNLTEWKNGKLKFKFTMAGHGKVKIFGDKSSASDITCKQGWINYEIK